MEELLLLSFGGISDPQLDLQFPQQTLEPACVPVGFQFAMSRLDAADPGPFASRKLVTSNNLRHSRFLILSQDVRPSGGERGNKSE